MTSRPTLALAWRDFKMMAIMGGVFAALAVGLWLKTGAIFFLYNFAIIGLSLMLGTGLWPLLPPRHKPWARRLSQLLVGGYMFFCLGMGLIYLAFGVITPENMQIEGFWFWLLAGTSAASVLHYLIAKILGPFLFNRGWCGWACWTAALLDFLPWKKPAGRLAGRWEYLRHLHFAAGLLLVGALGRFWGYNLSHTLGVVPVSSGATIVNLPVYASLWQIPELRWFLGGNLFYFAAGILLAWRLRDNRAFCKYLCPVASLLKIGARTALVKIGGDSAKCTGCGLCETNCPMDVRLTEYLRNGQRIVCSECILCLTCTSVCPQQLLRVTVGGDVGLRDRLRRKGQEKQRDQVNAEVARCGGK